MKSNSTYFRYVFTLFIAVLFFSCSSVEQYNKKLQQPISEKSLAKDVDYVQNKLQKLHPNLYQYISKEELNYKFDSLRSVLKRPITSQDFFLLLSPVVASVKQGHMSLSPPSKKISKREQKRISKAGNGPLSQFDFEWHQEKLYVLKNKSKNKTIISGAEVLSINKVTPQQLHDKYRKTYTSDGFNTTYLKRAFSKRFAIYLVNEIGINDSLNYVFKQNDSVKEVTISRIKPAKKEKKAVEADTQVTKKDTITKIDKKNTISKKDKRIFGYDKTTNFFSKKLNFVVNDSSISILKLKDFSQGNYKKAYQQIFAKLKEKEVKTLILDLRNNPGGRVADAVELYSYLTSTNFQMLAPAEVVSKTSLWKSGMFNKIPKIVYPFAAIGYPFYMAFTTLRTKKNDNGEFTYALVGAQKRKNKTNFFNGKMYVIINGSSFSAACLVSAALKENNQITFVGEETGGAFNSTVAGLLPVLKLPNSNLFLRVGLMDIGTVHKTNVIGRGVFPDVEVVPTLKEKIENTDPELNWILKNIKENSKQDIN